MDKRNDQLLAPTFGLEIRPKGKKVGLVLRGQAYGLSQGDIGKAGVGIDKNQIIPLGLLGQLVASPSLSRPTGRQILALQQADSGIFFGLLEDQFGRGIGGVVVEHEDLEVGIVAGRQRFQAGADSLLLIPSRDQHGDFWQGGDRGRSRRKAKGFKIQKVVKEEEA